jgi:hypothetical protein
LSYLKPPVLSQRLDAEGDMSTMETGSMLQTRGFRFVAQEWRPGQHDFVIVTEEMIGEWEMGCFSLDGVHYTSGMVGSSACCRNRWPGVYSILAILKPAVK